MGRLGTLWSEELRRLRGVQRRNLATLRARPWQECSGGLGDFGTWGPIFIALAAIDSASGFDDGVVISVSSTLVFSGLANILTGLYFGIPLPVQPMKAIAAVAIGQSSSAKFGASELASAGLFVSSCVGFLALTGLLQWFTKRVPVPVVKGIQMGAGLTLAMKAVAMFGDRSMVDLRDYLQLVPLFLGVAFFLFLMTFQRLPLALLSVGITAVFAALAYVVSIASDQDFHGLPWFSLWMPSAFVPEGDTFVRGAVEAGLGQLPLTTLNSIVAVVFLAEDLFPELQAPTATSIGISVTAMNIVGCWFRAMPVCHGSGGLAAQYRFGARSGASIIILGCLKLVLGLFASQFALKFCQVFPKFLLAVLLFAAGQELMKMGESVNGEAARDLWAEVDEDGEGLDGQVEAARTKKFVGLTAEQKTRRWTVMCATIIALVGAKNDGIGFIVGMLAHGAYEAHDWWEARAAARHEGGIRLETD